MDNPIIAEVTRAGVLESVHTGRYVLIDGHGRTMRSAGDTSARIFPRSALKLLQALYLVESGAADAFGLSEQHLAMACASHSSADEHTSTVSDMLGLASLTAADLQCGPHWPLYRIEDAAAMGATGLEPTPIHNNCSGKHAGFLLGCIHCGYESATYLNAEHPIQSAVRETLEELCDCHLGAADRGFDGCSAPTYAIGLSAFANAFARLFSGRSVSAARQEAAMRLANATMKNPLLVAGEGRTCTAIMDAGQGRIFAKFGAEGVYAAGIPDLGVAIALKCDDGSARAAEVLVAALLEYALRVHDETALADAMLPLAHRTIDTFAGQPAGELRAVV